MQRVNGAYPCPLSDPVPPVSPVTGMFPALRPVARGARRRFHHLFPAVGPFAIVVPLDRFFSGSGRMPDYDLCDDNKRQRPDGLRYGCIAAGRGSSLAYPA